MKRKNKKGEALPGSKREKRLEAQKKSELREKRLDLTGFEVVHKDAAGIDLGAREIWVAVPPDRDEKNIRQFGTFTGDLHSISNWLKKCGITTVAMESTGVYWVPLYEILENDGIEVYLVNAHHVKNVPGRKNDPDDANWLLKLHTFGLLSASFRPVAEIVELRELVRQRQNLIRKRATEIQLMQKALNLMNLKLTNVLSDITSETGLRIIRAIVAGEHNPFELAKFRDPRCKNDEMTIAKSLQGHYKEEQVFALNQALKTYDFFTQLIRECDRKIEECYSKFELKVPKEKPRPQFKKKKGRHKEDEQLREDLYRLCGVDLVAVDGLGTDTVLTILSHIGTDMSPWKTEKHFASWLGLAPRHEISGGKILKNHTQKNANRVTAALRQAAVSVGKTDTALGAFFRQVSVRRGSMKAIVATARKLAVIIYTMLKYGKEYIETSAAEYEKKYKIRMEKYLKRKAKDMGFTLVPIES